CPTRCRARSSPILSIVSTPAPYADLGGARRAKAAWRHLPITHFALRQDGQSAKLAASSSRERHRTTPEDCLGSRCQGLDRSKQIVLTSCLISDSGEGLITAQDGHDVEHGRGYGAAGQR